MRRPVPQMRTLLVVMAILALTVLTGVFGLFRDPLIAESEEELDRLHAAISLPRIDTPNVAPVPGAMRLNLAPDGIYLDVVAFLGSAPEPVVASFLQTLRTAHFEFALVQKVRDLEDFTLQPLEPPEGSSFVPEPLLNELSFRVLSASYEMPEPEGGFPFLIHADRDAPFELLRHVLEVAHEDIRRVNRLDPMGAAWPIVEVDGRPAALRAAPRLPAIDSIDATVEPELCAGPLAYVREDGVELIAEAYTLDGRSVEQVRYYDFPNPPPPFPEWDDRYVVAEDGRCPSVPVTDDGRHDLAAVAALTRRIGELAPGCEIARVGADDGVAWNEVAQVAATLLGDGGFVRIDLERRRWHFPDECRGRALP